MGLTDCTTNQNTTVKWKMRYIRRLCCLLPLAGCAKLCMMQSVLCTHTLLCHRHPALGTGTQPLALEVFKTQHKPLTFLLLACLPLFFFPSLTFSVPHSWCASFAICWRSQRVLYLCAFPLALAMNEPCACWALQWCQSWAWGCCLPSLTLLCACAFLHSCSARFWFTDHTCLFTKQALFQKVTLSNILSCFWKFYFKYPFQWWVFTSHLKKGESFVWALTELIQSLFWLRTSKSN